MPFGTRVKLAAALLAGMAVVGAGVFYATYARHVLRIANAMAARAACSGVIVTGRSLDRVLVEDAPPYLQPLARYITVVRGPHDVFSASTFGFLEPAAAAHLPGRGCVSVVEGDPELVHLSPLARSEAQAPGSGDEWPLGDHVSGASAPAVDAVLDDGELAGEGMRAIVVVHDGRIVSERYGEGVTPAMRQPGWSLSKSLMGAMIGVRAGEGALTYEEKGLFPQWKDAARADIRVGDLMAMQSGLLAREEGTRLTDVKRMVFLEPDQTAFALKQPSAAPPGTAFVYSNVAAQALNALLYRGMTDRLAIADLPGRLLFERIGMRSALVELDEAGTPLLASFIYATPRDFARFGLLLADGGLWNGERVLPESAMALFSRATAASSGLYTAGLAWKVGPNRKPNAEYGLPEDAFWLIGHYGQTITVIPSRKLVVLRMGLTGPAAGYEPEKLVSAVLRAIGSRR